MTQRPDNTAIQPPRNHRRPRLRHREPLLRTVFWAACLLLAGTPAWAAPSCFKAPGPAAEQLYARHRDFLFKADASAPLTASFARLLTQSAERASAHGEAGPIDWDFWTDAQDGDASATAQAVGVRNRPGGATVLLRYTFALAPSDKPERKTAEVLVVKGGAGCWLVDDLRRNGQSARALFDSSADAGGRPP